MRFDVPDAERRTEPCDKRLGKLLGDRRVGAIDDDREFVPANSRAARSRGRRPFHHFRDFAEQLIAGRMPVQVVDPLEVIEVEEKQDAAAAALDLLG